MGQATGVPEEIAAALARGATVLTGRPRAALRLRRAVDRANRAAGLGSWAPPRVLPWDAWTSELWHRLLLDGTANQMLLNRTQERALWESVIEADAAVSTLRSTSSLARLASEAWGMLARYRGLGRLQGSSTNFDTEAFARWATTFQSRCRDGGYLTVARLEGVLRQTWQRVPASRPSEPELLLVGFDRLLPTQKALLDNLREAGCLVPEAAVGDLPRTRTLVAAENEADEVRAAAEWAREFLADNPTARLEFLCLG